MLSPIPTPERRTSSRILLVEDNEDLAFGLRRMLEANGYTVDVAGDGARALQLARILHPQLIILDLMLPVTDGFGVLSTLRHEGLEMPVLILSAKSEETDKLQGFQRGADDFVTKPFGLLELLARVQALLRRATAVSIASSSAGETSAIITFGDCTVEPVARRVVRDDEDVPMTPKEFELLMALIRQPGVALSRKQLLRDVWGHAPDIQTRTVDIHIVELRRKLERKPTDPRHFITVWKIGYRFDP